ncbi:MULTISPECIES: acetyl-CoA C-acetyltransferase [unclassified Azospirillum]|uniref:acetyl-CoA C-acetyltransferase n=1 Tax=unclassified Azospirillum TaxID=2630922 RepID=UPI000B65A5D8|nr:MULTISPECIES: acetyl-CoA C-acetyltransferase [unclassified Azospirillum]SNT08594.1 acetyl-CoA C-acetyltransferase [Azospirillum sp. RU38E]SNT23021.1 acetyl-CoA C-acetyltransferase [Azospirillum sp. RU37A]
MTAAYLVEAVRTAGGRRNGRLSGIHANDLGGIALTAIAERTGIDPEAIDDVIFGCVSQAGEQSMHIGRSAVLASCLPQSVPAVTIDRQCGSSQQAIQFAAQAVMSGTQDIIIAGGVESMSRVPMGTPSLPGTGAAPWSAKVLDRYGVAGFSQFSGAEMIAAKNGFSRQVLDEYALESHRRAAAAIAAGVFTREIIPVPITLADGTRAIHTQDEGVRLDASLDALAGLKTLVPDGVVTAGNASQVCDGSSAVLVVSERALKEHNLTPIARIVNMTVTAGDPVIMLEEPLFATDKALKRAGLHIDDIDLYEVNEAFAPVPLAWLRHVGADPAKLNVHGGAIALGHPLGASGTKLMATLVHALRTRGKKYGLQTMCEGGGIANVTIVEAL